MAEVEQGSYSQTELLGSQDTEEELPDGIETYFNKVTKDVSSKWDDLARKLGFNRNEIKGIQTSERDDNHRCIEMLDTWRNREGREATLQDLKKALIDIGEKKTAEDIEDLQGLQNNCKPNVSRDKPKRTGQDQEHTGTKPTAEPQGTGESYKAHVFDKLVENSKTIFHEQVFEDPATFALAVEGFERVADTLLSIGVPELSALAKVMIKDKVRNELDRVHDKLFTDNVLHKTALFNTLSHSFKIYGATLRKIESGCVLCYLEFENASRYDTFLSAYRDGRLSATLTQELITDDMRAAEGEGLYVHVTLLGADGECQDDSLTSKGCIGNHATGSTDIETSEHEEDDTDLDSSVEENNAYFKTLKMSKDIFNPTTVTEPNKFEKANELFQMHSTVFMSESDSDSKPFLEGQIKLKLARAVDHHVEQVHDVAFTERALSDLQMYNRIGNCFRVFCANLKNVKRGCVLCCLDFDDTSCYRTFLAAYRDGRLSETLTRELITDDMRAAEGEDLYVHVTLLGADGECQDDSLSDEDQPKGSTEGSQVGSTTLKLPVLIKQESLYQHGHMKPDPSGTADRGPPHPGPSRKHSGQGPPAPGSSNHGDDTPPGYHGDNTGVWQVAGGDNVIQVKEEPAEQVPPYCMMGTVKSEVDTLGMEVKEESELDRQFAAIADHLGSMWERLASSLGFNTEYILDLTARLPPSLRPHQLICDWMERNVGDVTLEQLVQALRDAGIHEIGDAVDSGQLFLTEADCDAAKGKTDDGDLDTDFPGGGERLPYDTVSESSGSSGSTSEDEGSTSLDSDVAVPCHLFVTAPEAAKEKPDEDMDTGSRDMRTRKKRERKRKMKTELSEEEHSSEESLLPSVGNNDAHAGTGTSPSHTFFPLVAKAVASCWVKFAVEQLALTAQDVVNIQLQHPSSPEHQALQALELWRDRRGRKACRVKLAEALRRGGFQQTAEFCVQNQKLVSKRPKFGTNSADGKLSMKGEDRFNERSPDDTEREASASRPVGCHSNKKGCEISQEHETTCLDFASQSRTVSPSMYPTGEDASDWNDCLQDFFKTDEDTTRVTQESWPSNLLVKHLIRDRFFHSYLCEYWKQYQSFPDTVATFVEFVTEMSAKQYSFKNGMSHEQLRSIFANHCLILGKVAFENHLDSQSMYVYKSQFEWDDIREASFGWLQPAGSYQPHGAFQFVHDSIRQYLMAVWVAHTVRTQTDCTELLRACAEKSDHLPITCYSLAHLLGMTDSPPTYLSLFVTLLLQQVGEADDFNHLLSVVTTIAESKQLDVLSTWTQDLFPDKTLDLSALPEISNHGLHCLTQLIRNTSLIQTIKLPENRSIKHVSRQYPFGQKRFIGTNHTNQIRYLSYLPLSDSLSSVYPGKRDFMVEICFAKTDQKINVETIQQYFQFGQSLEKLRVRSNEFKGSTLGDLSKSLLFTPNATDVVIALMEVDGKEVEQAMCVFSCLNKLENVEFTEYRSRATCCLSVSWGTFMLKCKTRSNTWRSVLSFRPSDILEIVLNGALPAAAAAMLVSSFPHLTHLVKLRFNSLKIKSSEWSTLCQGLVSRPTVSDRSTPLELLACTNCNLADKEILVLSGLLNTFRHLKEVDLSNNDISDETVPVLAKGLGSSQNLKKLNLSHNKLSGRGYFLPPFPNLEEIDLSYNAISDEARLGLNEGFASCQNLTKVNLSHNKLSDRGDFLPPLPTLEEFDLSHNAISDKAVPNLAQGLASCQKLMTVNLSDNQISNMGAMMLWVEQSPQLQVEIKNNDNMSPDLQSLLTRRTDASQVTKLDLTSGKTSLRNVPLRFSAIQLLLQFLPQLPNLQELCLCVSCQGEEEAKHINQLNGVRHLLKKLTLKDWSLDNIIRLSTQMFPHLPLLDDIDLSNNAIGNEAVPGLAQVLGSCHNLKKVKLSFNKLSDRGDFLPPLPNLEEIDLSHNAIGDEALPGLAEGLGSCQNLKTVNLSNNKLSDRGDFLPPLPNLEEINLSFNAISNEAVPGLAEGLGSCQNLKTVNLEFNKLSDVRELAAAFINLPFLTHVVIGYNSISDESLPAIAAWMKVRTGVERVDLRGYRFSAEGIRDFVRTMKGKAYRWFSDNLLYDGSQANVGAAVESGGEAVRREEQQWERLWTWTYWIRVEVGQLRVWINHKGRRSNNLPLTPL